MPLRANVRGLNECLDCGFTWEVWVQPESGMDVGVEDAGYSVVEGSRTCPECKSDNVRLMEVD